MSLLLATCISKYIYFGLLDLKHLRALSLTYVEYLNYSIILSYRNHLFNGLNLSFFWFSKLSLFSIRNTSKHILNYLTKQTNLTVSGCRLFLGPIICLYHLFNGLNNFSSKLSLLPTTYAYKYTMDCLTKHIHLKCM